MTIGPFLVALVWAGLTTARLVALLRVPRWRAFEKLPPGPTLTEPDALSLTVVVPARNEAANIERCLRGLVNQTYPSQKLQIVVVDDNSTDETAAMARRIARSDARVQVIEAGPLPDGWVGKSHACWQGAMATQSEWLCFVDADTAAAAALLSSAVRFAQTHGLDLLSLYPFQEMVSFWERVILPWSILLHDLVVGRLQVNDPASPYATAIGMFILVRRHAYEAMGGHAAIRAKILEDVVLAVRVKRAGYRTYFMLGDDLLRVRMYTNLRGIWQGFSKSLVPHLNVPLWVLAAMALLLLAWLPVIPVVWTWIIMSDQPGNPFHTWAFGLSVLAFVETMSANVLLMTPFEIPRWYGLLLPVSAMMGAGIILNGAWQRATGRTKWKGRVYPLPSKEAK
jgi:chlorobactene glucosyltransferase